VSVAVRSGWTPRVARAPAVQTVPAGPGLSRFRCVCDGRDTVQGRVGPSAAARDRTHPRAGLRALGPQPDSPGAGPAASSPADADARKPPSRRRPLGSDAASCAFRVGLLAVSATPTTRFGVADTRARRPATPRASASLTVLARAGCAACRACAQTRSARGDGAGLRLPAPSFHARERVRSQGLLGGWSPVRAVSRAPSLAAALCEAVHRRKPCCLPSLSRLALRLATDAAGQTRGSAGLRR